MIRRRNGQRSLWDAVLFGAPDPRKLMEPALQRIDELLDDEALVDGVLEAMRGRFAQSGRRGRYGTPAEVALRMLGKPFTSDVWRRGNGRGTRRVEEIRRSCPPGSRVRRSTVLAGRSRTPATRSPRCNALAKPLAFSLRSKVSILSASTRGGAGSAGPSLQRSRKSSSARPHGFRSPMVRLRSSSCLPRVSSFACRHRSMPRLWSACSRFCGPARAEPSAERTPLRGDAAGRRTQRPRQPDGARA